MSLKSINRCDFALTVRGKDVRCANEATNWMLLPFAFTVLPVAVCGVHSALIMAGGATHLTRLGPPRTQEFQTYYDTEASDEERANFDSMRAAAQRYIDDRRAAYKEQHEGE